MGCAASKPAAESADAEEERQEAKGSANQDGVDSKDVNIGGVSSERSTNSNMVDEEFVAWSEMEAAEEQDYLVDEEKDSQLDQALEKMYSEKHGKREESYNDPAFWQNIMTSIEPDPDGFHLTAPFTLRKAHLLYRYLRTGSAKPLPRKFIYEARGSGGTRAPRADPLWLLLLERVAAPHAPSRWPGAALLRGEGYGAASRPRAPSVPRACRHSTSQVLIAACKQLEVQSKEQGALQMVRSKEQGVWSEESGVRSK